MQDVEVLWRGRRLAVDPCMASARTNREANGGVELMSKHLMMFEIFRLTFSKFCDARRTA